MEARPELITYFSEYQSRLSPIARKCTSAKCHKANLCYMRSGSPLQGQQCDSEYSAVGR